MITEYDHPSDLLRAPVHAPKRTFYILVLLVMLLPWAPAWAQKQMTWSGPMLVQGKAFEGEYEYYLSNRDTIRNGPFRLQKPITLVQDSLHIDYLLLDGKYKANRPSGTWEVRWGELVPVGAGTFDDYRLTFSVSGVEKSTRFRFNEQFRVKAWTIAKRNITNSKSGDTLFKAHTMLHEEGDRSEVDIQFGSTHITGALDLRNFLTGAWQFQSAGSIGGKPLGVWDFKGAYLNAIQLQDGNAAVNIPFFEKNRDRATREEMPLDTMFFNIVRLSAQYADLKENPRNQLETAIQQLLATNNVLQEGEAHFQLVFNTNRAALQAAVYKLPYTPSEKSAVETIYTQLKEANSILETINNDPQISLARISNDKVKYFVAVSDKIADLFLEPIEGVLVIHEQNMLEYIDRNPVVQQAIKPVATFPAREELVRPYTLSRLHANPFEQAQGLEALQRWSELIRLELEEIRDSIAYYLTEYKKEESLLILEGELINKYEAARESLQSRLSLELNELAGKDVLGALEAFMDSRIKQYSAIESSRDKSRFIESYIECFNNIRRLINTLEYVPENIRTIRDAYTREVFNPYTFTTMEETLKPQIIRSFDQVLVPALLDNITRMNCENVVAVHTNFERLFEGMTAALQRETRRVERRLRNTTDPSRATEILTFNLYFN